MQAFSLPVFRAYFIPGDCTPGWDESGRWPEDETKHVELTDSFFVGISSGYQQAESLP